MMSGPKMRPQNLPDTILSDPKRSAEVAVFRALEQSTELASAAIYYSCRWHADVGGIRRDGEADFLVAHPKWGILSLEVKGGRIGYDAQTDSWTSTDRHGDCHGVSDPFAQASKSKRVVLEHLRKKWPGSMPFLNMRHGVVFPHSDGRARLGDLPAYAPTDIIACSEHMETLGARIAHMLLTRDISVKSTATAPGAVALQIIEGFAGKDVDLTPLPSTWVSTVDRRVIELTEDQTRYLDLLEKQNVAVIEGGAGTGKTILAMEQARRSAAKGQSTLLLCFNRGLGSALRMALADTSVGVSTFHAFCRQSAIAQGMEIEGQKRSNPSTFTNTILPQLLEEIALIGPTKKYDHIIIDETQDFRTDWIECLRLFLTDQGRFWCFRDDFQNVQFGEDLLTILNTNPFSLIENVRNTRQIFEEAEPLRPGPRQFCKGPDGPPVEWFNVTKEGLEKSVIKTVNRLITSDKIGAGQIAVLLENKGRVDQISDLLHDKNIVGAEDTFSDNLVVDTIRRFKGLDRPVVILGRELNDNALDYLAFTRARTRLLIINSSSQNAI